MIRRLAGLALLATVTLAATAAAQTSNPTGSLIVMSRPSGASFRLVGGQVITARTPIVIERGLSGRYRLQSLEPGYNRWSRTLELNGVTADSVWMTLSPKSAAAAGLRSLIVPGWGQGYSARPAASAFWLTTALLVAGGAATVQVIYQQRQDDLTAAEKALAAASNATTLAAHDRAAQRFDDAKNWRGIAGGVAAGVWGLNFIEAIVDFPRIRAGQVGLTVVPAPGAGARAILSAGF